MCGGKGGGGGWGGIAGAIAGAALGYVGGGGITGALTGLAAGGGIGGAIGNAIAPAETPEYNPPILDIKGPASSNMGTGETGALVELGSDSAKAGRLSAKGTGSQASRNTMSGLGKGGLNI